MEKEEKAKVILDYDKYQELLERVRWSDLKACSIEQDAYDKATKEYERCANELREKIASLEKDNSDLCSALSNLKASYESLKHDCVDMMKGSRFEGYIDFTSKHGNNIYREVMDSLDKSLKTIPALSFWNYFTGKADRVFCDKIRTCVGDSITEAFFRILEKIKSQIMKIESISCQVRTARKKHVCELCLCTIHKGEEYGYEVLKVDGQIEAHKRHLECDELTAKDEFQTEDYGLRYTSETFYRAVCDYIHLHHNGDDSWTGSMFSRVIKILNEVNN